MKNYNTAVVIGRFSGVVHKGHAELFKAAAKMADNLIVVVGSSFKARDFKNPMTFDERREMIAIQLDALGIENHSIYGVPDYLYDDDAWVSEVTSVIENDKLVDSSYARKIADSNVMVRDTVLVGCHKDNSSWYLDRFPQYDYVEVPVTKTDGKELNATDIRHMIYTEENLYTAKDFIHHEVMNYIHTWMDSNACMDMTKSYLMNIDYAKPYVNLPYKPTFVTTDAVVFCKSHVLVVFRKAHPGKGLAALPGGFLNTNERIRDGIIRELIEETRIKVPMNDLIISKTKEFDHPNRSLRYGRTITHAGFINLKYSGIGLPKVRGSDDAEHARWIPLTMLDRMSDKFFEDHFSIIKFFQFRQEQM